jgi:FkbM family methyltransferase
MAVKRALKALIELTPYRIVRRAQNRFDAMEYSLGLLRSFGYRPQVVIDAGAHLGSFARTAARTFPGAEIHLIEPQRACHDALRALAGPFRLHALALGCEADVVNGLKLAVEGGPSTGAHISEQGEPIPVSTLDRLFKLGAMDRTLLKMDLQGYELQALRGGAQTLLQVEVVLTEVSFFAQAYEPSIVELINHLDENGFDLFDCAALSGRTRDNRLKQGDFIFVKRGSNLMADKRWA